MGWRDECIIIVVVTREEAYDVVNVSMIFGWKCVSVQTLGVAAAIYLLLDVTIGVHTKALLFTGPRRDGFL